MWHQILLIKQKKTRKETEKQLPLYCRQFELQWNEISKLKGRGAELSHIAYFSELLRRHFTRLDDLINKLMTNT